MATEDLQFLLPLAGLGLGVARPRTGQLALQTGSLISQIQNRSLLQDLRRQEVERRKLQLKLEQDKLRRQRQAGAATQRALGVETPLPDLTSQEALNLFTSQQQQTKIPTQQDVFPTDPQTGRATVSPGFQPLLQSRFGDLAQFQKEAQGPLQPIGTLPLHGPPTPQFQFASAGPSVVDPGLQQTLADVTRQITNRGELGQQADGVNLQNEPANLRALEQRRMQLLQQVQGAPEAAPERVLTGTTPLGEATIFPERERVLIPPTLSPFDRQLLGEFATKQAGALATQAPVTTLGKLQQDIDFFSRGGADPNGQILTALRDQIRQERFGDALSKEGKLVQDRERFVRLYGEGSPQVKALDESIQRENVPTVSEASTVFGKFMQASGNFTIIRDNFDNFQAARAQNNKAGDLFMTIALVKMHDPTSIVRESESQAIVDRSSAPDRLLVMIRSLSEGKRLPDSLRQELIREASTVYVSNLQRQASLEGEFHQFARANRFKDTGRVVIDLMGPDRELLGAGRAGTESEFSRIQEQVNGDPTAIRRALVQRGIDPSQDLVPDQADPAEEPTIGPLQGPPRPPIQPQPGLGPPQGPVDRAPSPGDPTRTDAQLISEALTLPDEQKVQLANLAISLRDAAMTEESFAARAKQLLTGLNVNAEEQSRIIRGIILTQRRARRVP